MKLDSNMLNDIDSLYSNYDSTVSLMWRSYLSTGRRCIENFCQKHYTQATEGSWVTHRDEHDVGDQAMQCNFTTFGSTGCRIFGRVWCCHQSLTARLGPDLIMLRYRESDSRIWFQGRNCLVQPNCLQMKNNCIFFKQTTLPMLSELYNEYRFDQKRLKLKYLSFSEFYNALFGIRNWASTFFGKIRLFSSFYNFSISVPGK